MASSCSIRRTRTVIDGFILPQTTPVVRQGRIDKRRSMQRQLRSTLRSNLGVSVVLACTCWTLSSASDILHANDLPVGVATGSHRASQPRQTMSPTGAVNSDSTPHSARSTPRPRHQTAGDSMALPELDVARVQRWCAARVPEHARHQVSSGIGPAESTDASPGQTR
jgi:hypothetical protein